MDGRLGLAAACAALLAGCASTQDSANAGSERMDEARRGVSGALISPLQDVGLMRPNVPAVLADIKYPYEVASLGGACQRVKYELGQLDAALGEENYQPGEEQLASDRALDAIVVAGVDATRDAVNVIPFRGLVRRVSGASAAEKAAARAVDMGLLRRSFLRGYGSALGCPEVRPAPPPEPAK